MWFAVPHSSTANLLLISFIPLIFTVAILILWPWEPFQIFVLLDPTPTTPLFSLLAAFFLECAPSFHNFWFFFSDVLRFTSVFKRCSKTCVRVSCPPFVLAPTGRARGSQRSPHARLFKAAVLCLPIFLAPLIILHFPYVSFVPRGVFLVFLVRRLCLFGFVCGTPLWSPRPLCGRTAHRSASSARPLQLVRLGEPTWLCPLTTLRVMVLELEVGGAGWPPAARSFG